MDNKEIGVHNEGHCAADLQKVDSTASLPPASVAIAVSDTISDAAPATNGTHDWRRQDEQLDPSRRNSAIQLKQEQQQANSSSPLDADNHDDNDNNFVDLTMTDDEEDVEKENEKKDEKCSTTGMIVVGETTSTAVLGLQKAGEWAKGRHVRPTAEASLEEGGMIELTMSNSDEDDEEVEVACSTSVVIMEQNDKNNQTGTLAQDHQDNQTRQESPDVPTLDENNENCVDQQSRLQALENIPAYPEQPPCDEHQEEGNEINVQQGGMNHPSSSTTKYPVVLPTAQHDTDNWNDTATNEDDMEVEDDPLHLDEVSSGEWMGFEMPSVATLRSRTCRRAADRTFSFTKYGSRHPEIMIPVNTNQVTTANKRKRLRAITVVSPTSVQARRRAYFLTRNTKARKLKYSRIQQQRQEANHRLLAPFLCRNVVKTMLARPIVASSIPRSIRKLGNQWDYLSSWQLHTVERSSRTKSLVVSSKKVHSSICPLCQRFKARCPQSMFVHCQLKHLDFEFNNMIWTVPDGMFHLAGRKVISNSHGALKQNSEFILNRRNDSASLQQYHSSLRRFVELPVRPYFHAGTFQQMTVADWILDLDQDSEFEDQWKTRIADSLLDEFEDVSTAEKRFMKLWNRFIELNPTHRGGVRLFTRCMQFVEQYQSTLYHEKLDEPLIWHMSNLWDEGFVRGNEIASIMNRYHELVDKVAGDR